MSRGALLDARHDARAARLAAVIFMGFGLVAVAFGLLRVYQRDWLIFYTEAPVLGSLTAMLRNGSLAAAYPVDGWSSPPLVLTLYPPLYLWLGAGLTVLTGTEGTFFAPRLLSLFCAGGVLWTLWTIARRRSVSLAWAAVLLGAWLITPATYNLIGAAQVDFLALLLTLAGVAIVLRRTTDAGPAEGIDPNIPPAGLAPLIVLFGLAFFTKQSFISAPAALFTLLVVRRRYAGATLLGAGLLAVAVAGTLALDRVTDGGYLANTAGALVGGANVQNLVSSLVDSAAWHWGCLLALVLLLSRTELKFGFPELYLAFSGILNVGAMLKTGSSVNYLLEPLAALMVLAIVRAPSDGLSAAGRVAPRSLTWVFVAGLALGSGWLAMGQLEILPGMARDRLEWTLGNLEGEYPLVEARFFPAVMQTGTLPYVNDPFAFGGLEERGVWNPARLTDDLSSGKIPYVLTGVDVRMGPPPPGLGIVDLLFGYFWLLPAVRDPILDGYDLVTVEPPWLWVPAAEEAR